MGMVRPMKFGALSLPDRESRMVCRSILLDMLGEATLNVMDGDLTGVTGLFWKYISLSLTTIYFPKSALHLSASGVNSADIVILRAIDGPLSVRHRKVLAQLQPRDVIFVPADAACEITLSNGGRLDLAHLPGYAMGAIRDRLKPLCMQILPADCLPLGLLTNYAGYLLRQEYQSEREAAMMVAHFYDLLPILIRQISSDSLENLPQGRLSSIKSIIEANMARSGFSISDVADAQGITTRAVQKFFSREGTTFSRYVLERRLELAKSMMLTEGGSLSISQIAYSVGFNDLSYFNRTFRSRYGVRPSDLRRAAASQL
ncbi:helix-turn-helix transcriptional regulator [Oryzifoliimicrobium ureilyticus]|uniref:helix-turn-helix transcriptional regulator n=1 Tax=Oryzifoliimicrobium ureilyticus TaxID=3113724 RepID=UPI0030760470